MQLDGTIFTYNEQGSIAYKDTHGDKSIIFIGGLRESILSLACISLLKEFCRKAGISLIVPQLQSHPRFELCPIEYDLENIHCLIDCMPGEIMLIGHSTGCQDILLYLKKQIYFKSKVAGQIRGIVLMSPASDIEAQYDTQLNQKVKEAKSAGKYFINNDILWLSERFISLFETNSTEDLFSSYLSDSGFAKWKC